MRRMLLDPRRAAEAPLPTLLVLALVAAGASLAPCASAQSPGGVAHVFNGDSAGDSFGNAVAGAGDIDGDGRADIVVGAVNDSAAAPFAGLARVFSGADGAVLLELHGSAAGDGFGRAVSGGGDVDGDGVADLVIGAPQSPGFGEVRVYSGRTGALLRTITGPAPGDAFAWTAAHAGDVDGDGYGDIVVGAHMTDVPGFEAGRTQVYSGRTGALLMSIDAGGAGWWEGFAVDGAGDVDNDGFADVVSGAPQENGAIYAGGAARVYAPLTGAVIASAFGVSSDELLGWSVAAAGDVDLDGHADVVIGAPGDATLHAEGGAVYVLSGKSGGYVFAAYGDVPNEHFGTAVAGAGDVDGDGDADVVGTAPDAMIAAPIQVGVARVLDGRTGALLFERRSSTGWAGAFGMAVAGVGDVDGDGLPELAVGAPEEKAAGLGSGQVVVYADPFASLSPYGPEGQGSGGLAPRLRGFGGLPVPGNAAFTLQVDQALGGSLGALIVGVAPAALPVSFGTFLVDPQHAFVVLPFLLGGAPGRAGAGSASFPAAVPAAAPLGVSRYAQALVADPQANAGIAHSRGLEITLTQ